MQYVCMYLELSYDSATKGIRISNSPCIILHINKDNKLLELKIFGLFKICYCTLQYKFRHLQL